MQFYIAIADIGPYRLWTFFSMLIMCNFKCHNIARNGNGEHSAIFPQVASLYQRWLEKRLFSDKRLHTVGLVRMEVV
jgi:hypothetical protein